MVAQPQTVASLVDMQGDEAVHRMPVMMIVHEMRKYALVLITFHCKLKKKTCLNLSRNWLQQFDEKKKLGNFLEAMSNCLEFISTLYGYKIRIKFGERSSFTFISF